jgi:hypothetical protein
MTALASLQPTTPSAAPATSTLAPEAPQFIAEGRPVNGKFNFYPRAAGVGTQQFDKQGFDRVGPSSQGWARTERQSDGSWRTTIEVPYGVHLGGTATTSGQTDRFVTLIYASKHQPRLNDKGRLFISGTEISGAFLERKLAELKLPLPDFRNFTVTDLQD